MSPRRSDVEHAIRSRSLQANVAEVEALMTARAHATATGLRRTAATLTRRDRKRPDHLDREHDRDETAERSIWVRPATGIAPRGLGARRGPEDAGQLIQPGRTSWSSFAELLLTNPPPPM